MVRSIRNPLVALVITLITSGGAGAQDAISLRDVPRSNAPGRALASLLADYNSGRIATERWLRWRSIYGPVDSVIIERSSAGEVMGWVRGAITESWLGLNVVVDSAAPSSEPEVIVFQLNGALPPVLDRADGVMDDRDLATRLPRYLQSLADSGYFSGAVLVARNGRIVFAGGYGSRHADGAPIGLDTRFNLASVGKSFTAVAILQLAQQGRLSLADTLGAFLPDYPHAQVRGATLYQLLTHTAGVGRSPIDWIALERQPALTELITLTTADPLFAPGEGARYSNEGYLLLGRVVEVASGMDYDRYLEQSVFAPAGMHRTGFYSWSEIEDAAEPLTYRALVDGRQVFVAGPRRAATGLNGDRGTPAGGAFSTASDLLGFIEGLRTHRLLDAHHFRLLLTEFVQQPPPFPSFGLGVEVARPGGVLRIGKGGDAWGVNTSWRLYPETGHAVVVLSNYDAAADLVATWIEEALTP